MTSIFDNYHIASVAELLNSKVQRVLDLDSVADVEFFNVHQDWVMDNGCMKLNKLLAYLIANNNYQSSAHVYPLPCGAGYYISGAARAIESLSKFVIEDPLPPVSAQMTELFDNLEFHTALEVTNG